MVVTRAHTARENTAYCAREAARGRFVSDEMLDKLHMLQGKQNANAFCRATMSRTAAERWR